MTGDKVPARMQVADLSNRVGLLKAVFFTAALAASQLSSSVHASPMQKRVPAGSPTEQTVKFQYAVYFLPSPSKDPNSVLQAVLQNRKLKIRAVSEIPEHPGVPMLSAHMENDVARNYAPPDMDSLRHFGRGVSREQAQALQNSRQAMILNFGHSRANVWDALRAANEVVEKVARETSGLVWDEETREIFTPDEWHKRRVATWTEGVPDISRHTVIHVYQSGEYVRAITLGMSKFGLPDVVIQRFSWSLNNNMGNLINAFCQSMAEGARFTQTGAYDLDIRAIQNPVVRKQQAGYLMSTARSVAHLTLLQGIWEDGDPRNRLIEIAFDRYPGKDVHAKQSALLNSLYGWQDEIKRIQHNDELLAASRKARTKLPALRAAFVARLRPGEFIQVKAPFATPKGQNEWMWVEVTSWKGKQIKGILKNEPFDIPDLHGGQIVHVKEDEVFDYIRYFPDGSQEGNETGRVIEKMQGKTERSK